jgi:hypothetical protein
MVLIIQIALDQIHICALNEQLLYLFEDEINRFLVTLYILPHIITDNYTLHLFTIRIIVNMFILDLIMLTNNNTVVK